MGETKLTVKDNLKAATAKALEWNEVPLAPRIHGQLGDNLTLELVKRSKKKARKLAIGQYCDILDANTKGMVPNSDQE